MTLTAADIVGTWEVLAHVMEAADGTVTHPHGEDHSARLIYSGDGHMAIIATRADRPLFTSKVSGRDISGATLEEKASAAEGCVAYSGRYEVRDGKVFHHIDLALFPNWQGTSQERFASLDGDRLTLSMVPDADGAVGKVFWQRVKGG